MLFMTKSAKIIGQIFLRVNRQFVFSPLNKASLFPGFSTSWETKNFQKKSRKSQDPENPWDSWEIFLGIFLELDYFAFYF